MNSQMYAIPSIDAYQGEGLQQVSSSFRFICIADLQSGGLK
ncbi:hypothetical protein CHCC5027_2165 [Bacillus paralicheniformis]|nr:hypothetical protein CHCC5027_2165 [Bacillus paralicheniformis]